MQQTSRYKLNLIEKADTFSPDPLNENTEKLEAQLVQTGADISAEARARADADAAEAKARTDAVSAEAQARANAIAAEAQARADADAAETSARRSADASEANTRAAAIAALDNRVKAQEAHKLVTGRYAGNGVLGHTISLGFTPVAVLVVSNLISNTMVALAVTGFDNKGLAIVANGFKLNTDTFNDPALSYNYAAWL